MSVRVKSSKRNIQWYARKVLTDIGRVFQARAMTTEDAQSPRVKPRLQDTTCCQTGCQTGLTTGLTNGCIVYTAGKSDVAVFRN